MASWEAGPRGLLPVLRGRVLFLVGDSLLQQQFIALACGLLALGEVSGLGPGLNSCVAIGSHDAAICFLRSNRRINDTLEALSRYLRPSDIVLVNTGLWFWYQGTRSPVDRDHPEDGEHTPVLQGHCLSGERRLPAIGNIPSPRGCTLHPQSRQVNPRPWARWIYHPRWLYTFFLFFLPLPPSHGCSGDLGCLGPFASCP